MWKMVFHNTLGQFITKSSFVTKLDYTATYFIMIT